MKRTFAAILIVSALAAATRAQDQVPAFSSSVQLVEVYATVIDAKGELVTGLRQSGEQCPILRAAPDPYLQTRETELGIGFHHTPNVGIPQGKRLDSNDMFDRIGQVIYGTRCLGTNETG